MDNRPIGVFDSGLGGLTGVRELRKRLPHEEIIYFGDTGRVPYGSRSPETILQYARQDVAFLLSKNVKCIMAACGTVSSTYPAAEAAKLPVPYLGVVDAAAREAAFATRNRRIGVIGQCHRTCTGHATQHCEGSRHGHELLSKILAMSVAQAGKQILDSLHSMSISSSRRVRPAPSRAL